MAGLGRRSHYRKHLTDSVLNDLPEPDDSLGQRIARVVGTRGGNMFDVLVAPPSTTKETKDLEASDNDDDESNADEESAENGDSKQLKQFTDEDANDLPPIQSINPQRSPQLAFLPAKFRKLVWIKRNDFVIVECGDEEEDEEEQQQSKKSETSGFRYVIRYILYKDQVKHIKSKGLWPQDPLFADGDAPSNDDILIGESLGMISKGKDGEADDHDDAEEVDDNEPQYGESGYEENGIVFDNPLADDMYMVNTNRLATLRVEDSSSDEDSD